MFRSTTDPLKMLARITHHFWKRVDKGDGCWTWRGAKNPSGYGSITFWLSGKYAITRAHRLSWILTNGLIADDLYVCHRCDNPPCVRPDHLFLGTAKDNKADCIKKGRAVFHTAKALAASIAAHRAQTHCKRGHPLSGENLRLDKKNHRFCRACAKINMAAWKERQKVK